MGSDVEYWSDSYAGSSINKNRHLGGGPGRSVPDTGLDTPAPAPGIVQAWRCYANQNYRRRQGV
ncbi:hypothetical protein JL721_9598 [Aureococcus anophagefferens]|nr:hypothetical protein JL721_9598 [Aureococcus anophagefferens]